MPLANLLPAVVRGPLVRLRHGATGLWTAMRAQRRPLVQHGAALRQGVPAAELRADGRSAEPVPRPAPTAQSSRPARAPRNAPSARHHPVRYRRRGVTLEVSEDDTLLAAALAAGLELPHACQMGLCGTCKSRLVSGQVQMTEPNTLGDEERARGYCLPCVSHPRGPVELDA